MTIHRRIQVAYDNDELASICRAYGIRRLSAFGSALREDFSSESDIDLLVVFEPGTALGFRIFELEAKLSEVFGGRPVDLVREAYLNRHLRSRVLPTAETLYAA